MISVSSMIDAESGLLGLVPIDNLTAMVIYGLVMCFGAIDGSDSNES